MATNKYNKMEALLKHTGTYTFIMGIGSLPIFYGMDLVSGPANLTFFMLSCIVFHTIQDFITSKLTHKQFKKQIFNGWNGAFTIIGLDQVFHYIQIFGTFYYLTKDLSLWQS
jgi:hypothetical protein